MYESVFLPAALLYTLAVDELVVKFNHLIEANRRVGTYAPIEQVMGRVKTISSILEKCQKKGISMNLYFYQQLFWSFKRFHGIVDYHMVTAVATLLNAFNIVFDKYSKPVWCCK